MKTKISLLRTRGGFTARVAVQFVTLLAVWALSGCATQLEAPPVEVTYRESLLGAGNILRIQNMSDTALLQLEVTIKTANGEVSYREETLPGKEVLEVGWKKLNGFEIPNNAEVEVKAEGYLLPKTAVLDDSESGGGGAAS